MIGAGVYTLPFFIFYLVIFFLFFSRDPGEGQFTHDIGFSGMRPRGAAEGTGHVRGSAVQRKYCVKRGSMTQQNEPAQVAALRRRIATLEARQRLLLDSHLAREFELQHMENCIHCQDPAGVLLCEEGGTYSQMATRAYEAVTEGFNQFRASVPAVSACDVIPFRPRA